MLSLAKVTLVMALMSIASASTRLWYGGSLKNKELYAGCRLEPANNEFGERNTRAHGVVLMNQDADDT